jgi:hypothetical protein
MRFFLIPPFDCCFTIGLAYLSASWDFLFGKTLGTCFADFCAREGKLVVRRRRLRL